MKEAWLGSRSVVSPKDFKRKLARFAPRFAGTRQHDAQEFLSFLLDGIHEDLNLVIKKPYIEDIEGDGTNDEKVSMKSWQNYLMRNKSIIVDIFQGQLKCTLKCKVCSNLVVKFDPFMYLSLPLSNETKTLDDCLKLFCEEESLTGDNQWYCPKCKKHVDATMRTDLWTLPPILIVHLKRFKQDSRFGRCSKNKQHIQVKLRGWDLDTFVSRQTLSSPVYDLYAVSNHMGSVGGGHYTAYAKNRVDNEWYHFNDSRATKISQSTVANNEDAYVLFFNRVVDSLDDQSLENGDVATSRAPIIVRQSINRPEHWPHLMTDEALRNYKRPHLTLPVPSQLDFNDEKMSDDNHDEESSNESMGEDDVTEPKTDDELDEPATEVTSASEGIHSTSEGKLADLTGVLEPVGAEVVDLNGGSHSQDILISEVPEAQNEEKGNLIQEIEEMVEHDGIEPETAACPVIEPPVEEMAAEHDEVEAAETSRNEKALTAEIGASDTAGPDLRHKNREIPSEEKRASDTAVPDSLPNLVDSPTVCMGESNEVDLKVSIDNTGALGADENLENSLESHPTTEL